MADTAAVSFDITFEHFAPAYHPLGFSLNSVLEVLSGNLEPGGGDEGPNVPGYPSGVWAVVSG